MRSPLFALRFNDVLCGTANSRYVDKDLRSMMARDSVKQSPRYRNPFAPEASHDFPILRFSNDELHFPNVPFGNVYPIRVVACCASACHERKDNRSFLAVTTFDGFVIRRTSKHLRAECSRE